MIFHTKNNNVFFLEKTIAEWDQTNPDRTKWWQEGFERRTDQDSVGK